MRKLLLREPESPVSPEVPCDALEAVSLETNDLPVSVRRPGEFFSTAELSSGLFGSVLASIQRRTVGHCPSEDGQNKRLMVTKQAFLSYF